MRQVDFRALVLTELERRGWSIRTLVLALDGRVAQRTIYSWLRDGHELGTDKLACVLDVLAIPVRPRRARKRKQRVAKK